MIFLQSKLRKKHKKDIVESKPDPQRLCHPWENYSDGKNAGGSVADMLLLINALNVKDVEYFVSNILYKI